MVRVKERMRPEKSEVSVFRNPEDDATRAARLRSDARMSKRMRSNWSRPCLLEQARASVQLACEVIATAALLGQHSLTAAGILRNAR